MADPSLFLSLDSLCPSCYPPKQANSQPKDHKPQLNKRNIPLAGLPPIPKAPKAQAPTHQDTMGAKSAHKYFGNWIDSIPNGKLEGGMRATGKFHFDRVARLDAQDTFTKPDGTRWVNIQMQVNMECPISTFKRAAPASFAFLCAPLDNQWSAAVIKEKLKASITGRALP
ncbi:hypothetical protein BKA63DRAFT_485872 [Paraphoma chrysanthemicola]|nr:hypothetical protein BKA63DRAFT_485872 [Paraphoma chrysanthemicola]